MQLHDLLTDKILSSPKPGNQVVTSEGDIRKLLSPCSAQSNNLSM